MSDVGNPTPPSERIRLVGAVRQAFGLVRSAAARELYLGILLEAINAVAIVLVLVSGREVVASLTVGDDSLVLRDVLPETLLLGAGLALTGVTRVIVGEFRFLVGLLAVRETQRRIVAVATRVRYQQFETAEFHDLLQRANAEGAASSHQVVTSVLALTNVVLTSASITVVLLVTVPEVLIALVLVAVPFALAARAAAKLGYRVSYALTPSDRLRAYLYRALTTKDTAKEVRVLGLADPLRSRWEALHEDRMERMRRMTRRRSLFNGAAAVASAAMIAAVLVVLVRAALRDDLSLADAAIAIVALQQLATRIRSAAGSSGALQRSALFLRDLQVFLDQPVELAAESEAIEPGSLVVADVGFTYPGTDTPVLYGVNLRIDPGEVVGLVGVSGSGKSTLSKLVANLYDVESGSITYGGVDLRDIPRASYWRHIAPVFQDFVRYELTARENIGVGDLEREDRDEALRVAAQRASAEEFIAALSNGFDTLLSRAYEGGADLSIGQWQRLAVARAFFRDAPLLILDEPASALDARSEAELFETIRSLAEGRSVLLVSHRFNTIQLADRIVVLDAGRVAEEGTHAELMAAGGIYAELYRLQSEGWLGQTDGQ